MQLITIIGRLGRDPETKTVGNTNDLIMFTVAVNLNKENTVWYDCNIWEKWQKSFEGVLPYLRKGNQVCISGELSKVRTYMGKDGTPKSACSIDVRSIKLVGGDRKEEGAQVRPQPTPPLPEDAPDYPNLPF